MSALHYVGHNDYHEVVLVKSKVSNETVITFHFDYKVEPYGLADPLYDSDYAEFEYYEAMTAYNNDNGNVGYLLTVPQDKYPWARRCIDDGVAFTDKNFYENKESVNAIFKLREENAGQYMYREYDPNVWWRYLNDEVIENDDQDR